MATKKKNTFTATKTVDVTMPTGKVKTFVTGTTYLNVSAAIKKQLGISK